MTTITSTPPTPTPPPAAAAPAQPAPPVNVSVTVSSGEQKAQDKFHEFLVLLDDQAQRKVEKAFDMPVGPKRREFVIKTLRDNMMKTQQPLWDVLEGLAATGHVAENGYQPLWIQNAIVVKGDDHAEEVLAHAAGVAQAIKSATYTLDRPAFEVEGFSFDEPMADAPKRGKGGPGGKVDLKNDPQWNLKRMGIDKAREQGLTGKGVTVGIIDTGVDYTHPALLSKYRGYDAETGEVSHTGNWFDATDKKSPEPVDDDHHGTHVDGTVLGSYGKDQVGMAPDAQWIAARGLGEKGGTDGMLLQSFQYMAAPLVPTPGTSPGRKREPRLGVDVINNSWGSVDGLSMSYYNALRNMAAMGIVNVFSAGNDGQGGKAGSIGSPASSAEWVISVGATDRDDKVAEFSSRGPNPLPTSNGDPVPFVSAPGVDIRSTIPGGKYERGWQGTSMAGPAVTGLVLLAQQAAKEETGKMFDVRAMKDVIRRAAQDVGRKGPDDETGYGIPTAENLRAIVKQVAVERGLVKPKADDADKPAPKVATRSTRKKAD